MKYFIDYSSAFISLKLIIAAWAQRMIHNYILHEKLALYTICRMYHCHWTQLWILASIIEPDIGWVISIRLLCVPIKTELQRYKQKGLFSLFYSLSYHKPKDKYTNQWCSYFIAAKLRMYLSQGGLDDVCDVYGRIWWLCPYGGSDYPIQPFLSLHHLFAKSNLDWKVQSVSTSL